jgi:DNA polymerase-3 subunit delta'
MKNPALSPALLIIGNHENTKERAHRLIQQVFCTKETCTAETCSQCKQIQIAHHQALWISPEKKYTLAILEPISHKINFTLDVNNHFFFILEKADLLTPSCANSLLKMVEEPPQGYHFLFLASQTHLIIPTIRSRCHIIYTHPTTRAASSGFLRHFMGQTNSAVLFLKELQTDCPEDYETPECLDLLMKHWSDQHRTHLLAQEFNEAQHAQTMLSLLQQAAQRPPMPGSAKIFWRDLFLQKSNLL